MMNSKLASAVVAALVGGAMISTAHAETVLRLGHVWPPNEIHAKATEQFAEDVAEATNGEVKVEIFGGSKLGSDREVIESLRLGTADLWVGGAGNLSGASETAKIFTVPFMFDDLEHFKTVYNGQVGEEITQAINEDSGYQVVSYWMRGPRWLTTKEEVKIPENLGGMKIRVPDSPVFVKSWEQLGAAPTPMNFGEVFTALQQGVIDGQENPLSLIYNAKLSEVVKYLGRTEHVMEPIIMVANTDRFSQLSEDQKEAIINAANGRSKQYVANEVLSGEQDFLQKLQEQGMVLVEVDKEAFRNKLSGFVDNNFPSLKPVYEKVRARSK